MSGMVTAIYEQGVLRLLTPLRLPERTRVQVQVIVPPLSVEEERQRVRQALLNAGVIHPRPVRPTEHIPQISEAQLAAVARALAAAGPLSELIISERDGR